LTVRHVRPPSVPEIRYMIARLLLPRSPGPLSSGLGHGGEDATRPRQPKRIIDLK